ncbi:hypothetical protein ACRALDRAFT_211207 [Sodiomyces alcalophilus JCM 7366]|uniref:uncharacterized protein n=1 Tax=Sodiomyces alcalophilus JCM 7366 TaxID=591952 RepID=UPI0039B588A9
MVSPLVKLDNYGPTVAADDTHAPQASQFSLTAPRFRPILHPTIPSIMALTAQTCIFSVVTRASTDELAFIWTTPGCICYERPSNTPGPWFLLLPGMNSPFHQMPGDGSRLKLTW